MSKYGAKKTTFQGRTFDSKKEAQRFAELRYMQMAGLICDLRTQVRFILIPNQYDEETGKVIERAVTYVADFVYQDLRTCKTVVEDIKSSATKTPQYIIKRKLMLQVHGIRIKEV